MFLTVVSSNEAGVDIVPLMITPSWLAPIRLTPFLTRRFSL